MTDFDKLSIIQNNLTFANTNEATLLDDDGNVNPYWEATYPHWFE